MNAQPLLHESFTFKKIPKLFQRSLIGFDTGCSLTKIVFVDKRDEHEILNDEIENVTFQYAIFSNDKVEESLEWVKERAIRDEKNNYPIHITGVGAFKYKKLIEDLFCCETEVITEELSIVAGIKYSLENIGELLLTYDKPTFPEQNKLKCEITDRLVESLKKRYGSSNDADINEIFPCAFHISGFSKANYYFNRSGKATSFGFICENERTFLGLSKCILNTNNYSEIIKLANEGNRQNVDSVVKEAFSIEPNSIFETFPPYYPVFPFGKCVDYNLGSEQLNQKDMATSTVALTSLNSIAMACSICKVKNLTKVYVIGQYFDEYMFRLQAEMIMAMYPMGFEIVYIKSSFMSVLGVIMTKNEEKGDYLS